MMARAAAIGNAMIERVAQRELERTPEPLPVYGGEGL